MATFKLLKSEVKPLTRELAAQFRDMKPSPTERDLKPARLKHLREKAEAGHLVTFNWASAKMGGEVLRMNGQHSSNVLCELNGAFPENLFVHLDQYEVDGPEGLALLFRQFDARQSGRSAGDVAGAYQMLHPELHGVAKGVAKLGIEGVAWYSRAVEGAPVPTGDDIYDMFGRKSLYDFLLWLNELFTIKTPELSPVQVVAAMYATFIKNTEQAKKFWDQVARGGVEFENDAPATVLDAWLRKAKSGEMEERLKPAQYYQGSIYAWNAFRKDKPLESIKPVAKNWYMPAE
jgi:hypothetical protein